MNSAFCPLLVSPSYLLHQDLMRVHGQWVEASVTSCIINTAKWLLFEAGVNRLAHGHLSLAVQMPFQICPTPTPTELSHPIAPTKNRIGLFQWAVVSCVLFESISSNFNLLMQVRCRRIEDTVSLLSQHSRVRISRVGKTVAGRFYFYGKSRW